MKHEMSQGKPGLDDTCGLGGKYSWKREEKGKTLKMNSLEYIEGDIWIQVVILKRHVDTTQ